MAKFRKKICILINDELIPINAERPSLHFSDAIYNAFMLGIVENSHHRLILALGACKHKSTSTPDTKAVSSSFKFNFLGTG
jgi:hypothetical protein